MEQTATAPAAEVTEKPQFTGQTTVGEALRIHPEAGLVLASFHLGGCSHCGINEIETLEQICMGYGVPLDALLASMNALLEE
ncbi:MAG: disulfide oxidoreductase [Spirochaetes bacterium]|nr:disulfide oxidoreductase [Spirochaetota bacterium]